MTKVAHYSRAERKRQIVWHMMNAWVQRRDKRWPVSRIARVLGMEKSQHLRLILKGLESDGVVSSQLEPFRGWPRRIYSPVMEGVQLFYSGIWEKFLPELERGKQIVINGSGGQSVMFPDWR